MKERYLAVLQRQDGREIHNIALEYANKLAPIIGRKVLVIDPLPYWKDDSLWQALMEENDISFFLFQIGLTGISLNKTLVGLRNLRVPYIAVPRTIKSVVIPKRFVIPVGFLPEEKEKGIHASSFSKKIAARVIIIEAKSYGSRASQNTNAINNLFKKKQVSSELIQGKKYSERIDFEALDYIEEDPSSLLWISATREYALDDLFFGPKELRLLKKSKVPVLILNPRGDLYDFCE